MLVDAQWVYKKYDEFSQKFFGGKMPSIHVKIGRSLRNWGLASCTTNYVNGRLYNDNFIITISNAYDSPEKIKETTLLHEMIHIYDYFNFPEHFTVIVRGGIKGRRDYDSHRPEVFMPMAQKINKYGYNITKYVTTEEKTTSVYTDKTKQRLEKPVCLCYAEFMRADQENLMFLTTPETLKKVIKRYKDPIYSQIAPISITVYEVSSPELRRNYSVNRGDRIRGYSFPFDKWFTLLSHLGIENQTPAIINFDNAEMYEEKKKIIKLTESDLRSIIKETLNELMDMQNQEPIDGENAVGVQTSPTSIQLSIV